MSRDASQRTNPDRKDSADESAHPHATFVARKAAFDLDRDVILPPQTRLQIDECRAKLFFHEQIYEVWNFKSVDPMGSGMVLNFYGPPGTGKTLAAEAFAGTLEKQFIQIGIAEIESKYMGETAIRIQKAFADATASDAVLFFDEADTLLGKRLSSVTQGVDNEVNAMRSTMLIELPRFKGIVIFASNFVKNYDEAFRGRISYHVRFDLPDMESRRALWRHFLIQDIPIAGDPIELVSHAVELSEGFSGRDIRTCMRLALPKAFLDKELQESALSIRHLEEAISEVKRARAEVGPPVAAEGASGHAVAKRLLGIQ